MRRKKRKGSLTIAGTGIEGITHISRQAQAAMEGADKLLYSLADPATTRFLRRLNPAAESVAVFYGEDKPREVTYAQEVEHILGFVRQGLDVCVAYYGHPGVYCNPGHAAVRRARSEGFPACMLPAISALDCLFADLGMDPGAEGCQTFTGSQFLRRSRRCDPSVPLVLFQVGLIGVRGLPMEACNRQGVRALEKALRVNYPANHMVTVYEASQFAVADAHIARVRLAALPRAALTPISTLYVPPVG